MADTTDLAKKDEQKIQTIATDDSSFSSYLDTAKFNQLYRVANVFAASDIVPEHYRNKPANCFLALQMATRLEIEPMMFIQNSYVVHGKPGLQAVVMIALVNSRGPFTGPIQWKFDGKGNTRSCTAYATHKVTKEVCSTTVSWDMVDKEGWNKKAGSKWLTMPDLMFQYRSAAFLARLYCPEVILGLPMAEELEDIESGNQYKPAAPTGRIEERMAKKAVESQVVESEPAKEPVPADNGNTASGQASFPKHAGAGPSVPMAKVPDIDLDELNKIAPPPNDIPENERYYCKECEDTFPKPAGTKKNLCPKLHAGIIDRWLKQ